MRHTIVNITFISILLLLALLSLFVSVYWWHFAAILLVWFGIAFTGSAWIGSNYHVKTYCSNPAVIGKKIALTFDDGPTTFTRPILETLRVHEAKATFFCIGKNIEQHPDIVREAFLDGHIIGNHSFLHGKNFDFLPTNAVANE
ncbi:MAG: polysaccharide deacetylase family protein, partial [Proteobacteria bacterium]